MRLQRKLIQTFILLVIPLLLNLLIFIGITLNFRSVTQQVTHLFETQSDTLHLKSQFASLEATLLRYQIDGDVNFQSQYTSQLAVSNNRLNSYLQQYDSPNIRITLDQLNRAFSTTETISDQLILLQDSQRTELEAFNKDIILLFEQLLGESETNNRSIGLVNLITTLHKIESAVLHYLIQPDIPSRIAFADATADWNTQIHALHPHYDSSFIHEIETLFMQIENNGERLINDRDQQQAEFALFSANQFVMNEQLISQNLIPYTSENLHSTQVRLITRLNIIVGISIFISTIGLMVSVGFAVSILRRLGTGFTNLLEGANRVTQGEYTSPIVVESTDEIRQLADTFNLMMSEIRNRQQRLESRISELVILRKKLAVVQEEERRMVGLDLHDGLSQILLSANMHTHALQSYLSPLGKDATRELNMVKTRLQEAIHEVRWMMSELRPTDLEDFGFLDGLRHYANRVAKNQGWILTFEVESTLEKLDAISPIVQTVIFRVMQEALSNARKHAETTYIAIEINLTLHQLQIWVKDQGKGFNLNMLQDERKTTGLIGMKERVQSLDGELLILSHPHQGTQICINIPI